MTDVLSLRVARAPQRLLNENVVRWPREDSADVPARRGAAGAPKRRRPRDGDLLGRMLAEPGNAHAVATSFVHSRRFAGGGAALARPVRELDTWLVRHDNRADPRTVIGEALRLFGQPLADEVATAAWQNDRRRVYDSLLAAIVARTAPAISSELARLLLIYALVEALAPAPSSIATADDVERALRYRSILIPKELLQLVPGHARLARRYGFADLYVVRDEWNRYEAGEIAHIENVLTGESKKRQLATLSETAASTSTETDTTTTDEHDSQTTDRMELQQHGQTETDLAVHVAAQVEVQAQYGPMVHIAANVGGSFDYSKKDAEDHAYQQSHEAVTRAVKRVEERVKTVKTTRSLERTTQKDMHALKNTSGGPVVGMYRWVDKIQRLQMFRYPHRMLLEFEIPEPAAFLIWRRSQPRGDFLTPEPTPLVRRGADMVPIAGPDGKTHPLQPDDITEDTYLWWVGQYNVIGVTAPPAETVQVTVSLEVKQQAPAGADGGGGGGGGAATTDASLVDKSLFDLVTPGGGGAEQPGVTIPDGYRLESWSATALSSDVVLTWAGGDGVGSPFIDLMVGNEHTPLDPTVGQGIALPPANYSIMSYAGAVAADHYPPASPVTGELQVTAVAAAARECRIHVTLDCARMASGLRKWQEQTYEQISAAYWDMKRQRADEQARQSTGAGVEITGDPPARNKEVIEEELKRGVIEMLTGANFRGRDAMDIVPPGTIPQVSLDRAGEVTDEIQFIEQAFEWENLTYVLYPYFWAGYARWPELADMNVAADPDFGRFLRSGSARVVVPARPNFESLVRMYVDFGALWGGAPAPAVDDPDYLSVAAEIEAQQVAPRDGEKGRSWEVRLPTTLVWLDNDSNLPKRNPNATLDAPPEAP
jgi:hypothetical protein